MIYYIVSFCSFCNVYLFDSFTFKMNDQVTNIKFVQENIQCYMITNYLIIVFNLVSVRFRTKKAGLDAISNQKSCAWKKRGSQKFLLSLMPELVQFSEDKLNLLSAESSASLMTLHWWKPERLTLEMPREIIMALFWDFHKNILLSYYPCDMIFIYWYSSGQAFLLMERYAMW